MPRHVGSGIKAWGISNTLKSKSGGGFARSERTTKDRKITRTTAGFRCDQADEKTVTVVHVLGDKHGFTSVAERVAEIDKYMGEYTAALSARFKVRRGGVGEQQYLTVTEYPNPAVAQTLFDAAERLKELGDSRAASLLLSWSKKATDGEDW